jgi:hypothetical protein
MNADDLRSFRSAYADMTNASRQIFRPAKTIMHRSIPMAKLFTAAAAAICVILLARTAMATHLNTMPVNSVGLACNRP